MNKKMISLEVSLEMYDEIRRYAFEHKISVSQAIRLMIYDSLQNEAKDE